MADPATIIVQGDNGTQAVVSSATPAQVVVSGQLQGPPGTPGAAGTAGSTGPTGPSGAPGAAGAKGDKGDTGSAGTNGAAGVGVPAGGTTGQVLEKSSNSDFATDWTTPSAGFTNPMTTLGDVMFENSTPAAARLAGNTTATKKYLSQTGNGSISANPAWAQIAVADLSGFGTNVAAALAIAVGSAGGPVTFNGAGGTPSSISLTHATSLTLPVGAINATGTPSSSNFLRGDGIWAASSGGISAGVLTGIIVAASNAPADWTAAANQVCDGTADQVQILAAIALAQADGRKIYLSPGTFNISATITVSGDDITDSDFAVSLLGAGAFQTNLVAGTNITLIKLADSCKVNIWDICLNVNGSGAGIQSRAVTTSDPYRSFWNSSFKNILIRGNTNQTNHTGWAMDLGSPFRSTFENIEAYNVQNGIKLFSENAAFNPGDCTFTRCFMELGLNANGIGYYLNGDASVMNHCSFIICEAFAYGATATGIKMDGSVGTMWNRFIGTNLEQFTTVIDIVSGEGNDIACNYIAGRDAVTSTIFKTEAGAYNNRIQAGFAYLNHSGTVWSDANTTTSQPNSVTNTKLYADTGATGTLTLVTGSVLMGNVSDGAGTTPTNWADNNRVETLKNKTIGIANLSATGTPSSTTYLRGDGSWSTPSGGFSNPMTSVGDLIVGSTAGAAARLAIGGATAVLMGGTTPAWSTTPAFGAITATTLNKVTITAPGTAATLTLITGSSLITAGAFGLTLTSTATTNATFPSGTHTLAGLDVAQTWSAVQTFSSAPSFGALPTGAAVASAATASTLAARDANGNLSAVNVFESFTTTATAAGTTTMTITSNQLQQWTGSSTQIIKLPTTSVPAGAQYIFLNSSTGAITIQSSGANTIAVLQPGGHATLTALSATPTTAAAWDFASVDVNVPQAISVTTNAGTADVSHKFQNFTNSSAAAMTITLTTTGAQDSQLKLVRIYDFSAVAEGISWVNTENSSVTAPATSNGSTTLPLSAMFQYNSATSKWRCIASV